MIDVKKLITGFLILAAAAGVSGLIFSLVGSGASANATAQTAAGPSIGDLGSAGTSPVALNAFVDTGSIQGNAAEVLSDTQTTSTATASADPDNLTNVFADSFLNGLVSANPDGAIADASGTSDFNAPDTQEIADEIASDPALQDFKTPNWAAEVNDQLIKTTSASPSDIAQYTASLNAIFNKYFVSTELSNLINNPQTTDPTNLPYVAAQVQGALSDTLALKVPSSLAGFQKSLVTVMVYEKDSADLGQTATTDPVKASLILENEQTQYTAAITDLQNQMKAASAVGLLFGPEAPSSSVPFIAQLFGVKPAQAQLFGGITFDPSVFGRLVLSYANDVILQILKNTLVSLIQQKVLTWIQGSGAPKFITDWGAQLVNSFQTAALNVLNKQISCVPIEQQQILKVLLSTPAVNNNLANSCAAEFQGQLGNNLTNYDNLYNNFTNFNDFFAVMGSTGNAWSDLITIHDSAIAAGSNAQTANQNQNAANGGFTGSATCADGSDPNGTQPYCTDGSTPNISATGYTCLNGAPALMRPNGGVCQNGQPPKVTTPGAVTGQSLFTALKSGVENITSANNIVGILNSLLSSLLNTLAQNAITAGTSAINGALSGNGGLTSIPPSSLTPAPTTSSQTAVQCLPSIQSAIIATSTGQATASIQAGGGSMDTSCAINNTCPSTENPDGTPIYNWSVGGPNPAIASTLVGSSISITFNAPGSYFATVTGSTDNTNSSCEIDVQ